MNRRNGLILATLVVIVGGFALLKAPKPIISIAAEEIIDLGGYTVTNTILTAWIVTILLALVTFRLYRRLRHVEEALVPRGFQNVIEALLEAFFNIVTVVAGEKNGRRFFPVVATIFLFLLAGNWFGLFPWNNVVGRTVDGRSEYLEELADDAEDLLADWAAGTVGGEVGEINTAFADYYLEPIPIDVDDRGEADARLGVIRTAPLSQGALAVREEFRADPIAPGTPGAELAEAIEERLRAAGVSEAELEEALLFNLPLPSATINETELAAIVIHGGGLNLIPLRADDFEFDPYQEPLVIRIDAQGASFAPGRVFERNAEADEENVPPKAGEQLATLVTINTAHLGIVLKMEQEGLEGDEGIGEIFPFFRSIATDLNLTLAIALWALIFVHFWGVQSLGFRTNFGRFVGLGAGAVVKGPIGVFVGFLEIISELARVISFTFRLFGNIFAGEILLFMAAFLVPFLVATVFYGLEVFVGLIQAFVFAMLTLVFAVTAVSHGEHAEEHEGEAEGV